MIRKLFFTFVLALVTRLSFGQTIDSLKLIDTEIPTGYSKSNKLLCVTLHASSFYDQTDIYETFLGKVTGSTAI